MRKLLICGIVFAGFVVQSCNPTGPDNSGECPYVDQTVTVPAEEITKLETFLDTSNIDAIKDSRGFYYSIQTLGAGASIEGPCNQVGVKYVGKLTNGTTFDQSTGNGVVFTLGQLIWGWRKALPLIKAGGKMTIYLPPTLGYGPQPIYDQTTGQIKIPGSSILIFEVELTDVI